MAARVTPDALERAARWIAGARRIVVFTGAGVSTDSGIPDFRGPQGLWRTQDPALWTIERYLAEPEVRRDRWRQRLASPVDAARPNTAHRALAALERGRAPVVVVTQNTDGLHQMAGSHDVIELHGTAREAACLSCERRLPISLVLERVREGDLDPSCELCGGILKTATISFGQQLVARDLARALDEARRCDVCLAVGSTLAVWPAAQVPVDAVENGARLVILNDGDTGLDTIAAEVIRGRAGPVLETLVSAALAQGG